MKNILKFSLILAIVLLFNIAIVSASDINQTGNLEINESYDDSPMLGENYGNETLQTLEEDSQLDADDSQILTQDSQLKENDSQILTQNSKVENDDSSLLKENVQEASKNTASNGNKATPTISVDSNIFYTGTSVKIALKNSKNVPLKNQSLTVYINKQKQVLSTNKKGVVSLKLDLVAKKYNLKVTFKGDDEYNSVTKNFKITVKKIKSRIYPVSKKVMKGKYFYAYLKDSRGFITGATVKFTVNGKTYTKKTNSKGKVSFKVTQKLGKHALKMKFAGDGYHESYLENANLYVPAKTSLEIGNMVLLTKGYLRIYLKSQIPSAISKKNVKITIGSKVFNKRANSEGIIVFKPKVGTGVKKIKVEYKGSHLTIASNASKKVRCINKNVKDPLKQKVRLRNGVPNVDYMPGNYVMGSPNAKYTLTKAQYKEVIKRDSYSLYLHNKLSKYTFFKTKAEPKLNHIVKREKWNVIERAINTKLVLKNSHKYWPSYVTVSLKGKAYHYSEVRDVQNTGYTCGPTSCSMCTQVLRNFVNEKFLGIQAGSNPYSGSSTSGLKNALEKNHFKCSYYYKSSFATAIKQLKKGGCALVFHTWNHYVAIMDISKNGRKVLVGNPSGDYNHGSHGIPTKWLTVKYMYGRFNNYDTSGLIVKLKYNLNKATKSKINNLYSSMGPNWARANTHERIPDTGY